jgi:glycosyltransferase involved in cell wall biosynthesis
MKPKMLLISNGFVGFSAKKNHFLQKYFDVDFLVFNKYSSYGYPTPKIENEIKMDDVDFSAYDVAFGLDTGCLPILKSFKAKSGTKIVCQILDFPCHCFMKNKNYSKSTESKWRTWIPQLSSLDGLIFNQRTSLELASQYFEGVESTIIRYPIEPIDITDYERKEFVLYIGRLSPDKGVYNLISALSFIPNPPKLITISDNPEIDLGGLAKYLKLSYLNISGCSEQEKWKLLHECLFTVFAGDAYMIPPLMITEGLSIGRSSVCTGFEEYRETFKDYVEYFDPMNLVELAKKVSNMRDNIKEVDEKAKEGIEFYRKNRSYEAWAEQANNFIEKIL